MLRRAPDEITLKNLSIFLSISVIVLTVFFLLYLNNQKIYMLEIVNPETGELVFSRKVEPYDKFTLESIHSLELSNIINEYQISENYDIQLVSTMFSGHSAGLPFKTKKGEKFSVDKDGKFKISNRYIQINKIPLRVQRNYGNVFVYNDLRINLSEMFNNVLLHIRVRMENA
ncbi:DUF1850 domain-containing protein [Candidatus Poribacteria bacterium]|nr:DUF1850 domain-containing protein [Candidatus Poribacteria bacterium]